MKRVVAILGSIVLAATAARAETIQVHADLTWSYSDLGGNRTSYAPPLTGFLTLSGTTSPGSLVIDDETFDEGDGVIIDQEQVTLRVDGLAASASAPPDPYSPVGQSSEVFFLQATGSSARSSSRTERSTS